MVVSTCRWRDYPECVVTLTISSGERRSTLRAGRSGGSAGRKLLVPRVRQFLTYVNGAPFQPAIAAGLRLGDDYFNQLAARSPTPEIASEQDSVWRVKRLSRNDVLQLDVTRYDPMVTVSPSARTTKSAW